MAKFSGQKTLVQKTAPVKTLDERVLTFEGGWGFAPDPESELFLAAATHMSGEGTFYESPADRDRRFRSLVHHVTQNNPAFVAGLAGYLRNNLLIRSASVVLAAEYVRAGGAGGRQVVASVLQRGDEPAEMIGYWLSTYGRQIPMAIKRGVADAVSRLYTERAVLRYDGGTRGVRMGDVLELVHPRPNAVEQSLLFKWLLDRRHHDDAQADEKMLPMLTSSEVLSQVPEDERRDQLRADGPTALARAGMTWERLSGWLPGGMDAEAWEAAIPTMGVMALARNLRNFDQAGISDAAVDLVISRLTDPEEVRRARMFPYQVWSAYNAAESDNWQRALGGMLDISTENVPAMDRTLVLIDLSGSMGSPITQRSTVLRLQAAAVMAVALAKVSANTDIGLFATRNREFPVPKGESVLRSVQRINDMIGDLDYGTNGHTAIAQQFDKARHDRVVMFTDDQMRDSGMVDISHVPSIYTVDLAGNSPRSMEQGQDGHYTLAGFTDAAFSIVATLEAGRSAGWPF